MKFEITEQQLNEAILQEIRSAVQKELTSNNSWNTTKAYFHNAIRQEVDKHIANEIEEIVQKSDFRSRIRTSAFTHLADKLVGGLNAMMIGLGKKLGQDVEFREEILQEVRRRLTKET